jgi:hypothetical protein
LERFFGPRAEARGHLVLPDDDPRTTPQPDVLSPATAATSGPSRIRSTRGAIKAMHR